MAPSWYIHHMYWNRGSWHLIFAWVDITDAKYTQKWIEHTIYSIWVPLMIVRGGGFFTQSAPSRRAELLLLTNYWKSLNVCVLFIPWKEISVLSPLLESDILRLVWKSFYSRIVHQVFTHGTLQFNQFLLKNLESLTRGRKCLVAKTRILNSCLQSLMTISEKVFCRPNQNRPNNHLDEGCNKEYGKIHWTFTSKAEK